MHRGLFSEQSTRCRVIDTSEQRRIVFVLTARGDPPPGIYGIFTSALSSALAVVFADCRARARRGLYNRFVCDVYERAGRYDCGWRWKRAASAIKAAGFALSSRFIRCPPS